MKRICRATPGHKRTMTNTNGLNKISSLPCPSGLSSQVGQGFNRWVDIWCCCQTWINEWGFRPHVCTSRLNWAKRTTWGWWDEWDDTSLQTQDSKFVPWRSEAEHATFRSRRLPTIPDVECCGQWILSKESMFFKINVTESDLHPRVLKMLTTF